MLVVLVLSLDNGSIITGGAMSNKRIQLNILITQDQKEKLRLIMILSGNRSMTQTIAELIDDKAERLQIDLDELLAAHKEKS